MGLVYRGPKNGDPSSTRIHIAASAQKAMTNTPICDPQLANSTLHKPITTQDWWSSRYKKPATQRCAAGFNCNRDNQLPSMVLITLDIGRASSKPPPISLRTMSVYSFFGSTGVLPTTCTTL